MKHNKIVIAVDGYSSCGKSTFAKAIAKQLGYIYIDTGAMYRSVSLFCIQNNFLSNENIHIEALLKNLDNIKIHFEYNENGIQTFLNNTNVENEIRSVQVSQLVSHVSKIKEVRQKLVALQQKMGENKGVVLDGRDIGTVVFPNAEIKIFMTADVDVRAERRFAELSAKGVKVNYGEIKQNIEQRDYLDENREESPLRKADDAIILDNSNMTPDEQMIWFMDVFKTMVE